MFLTVQKIQNVVLWIEHIKIFKKYCKQSIAICNNYPSPLGVLACHMGLQCYMLPGRGEISTFTPAN